MKNFILCVLFFSFFTIPALTVLGQESDKVRDALAAMGFNVTRAAGVEPTAYEKSEFGMKQKRRYSVKSVRPVPGERNLYYRYAVDIEAYPDQVYALNRLDRIHSAPPGPNSKMEPEYVLREGFQRGNVVYVVSTDVYRFVADKSLTRVTAALQDALPDFGDYTTPHVSCGPVKTFKIVGNCRQAVDAKKRYFSYYLTFDVVRVLEGEFSEREITFEAKPNWVLAGSAEGRLVEALGLKSDSNSFACDSSVPAVLTIEQEYGDRAAIKRTTLKDFKNANAVDQPKMTPRTARDYLMLLPDKYFVFESCELGKDDGCVQARLDYLKQFVDAGDITDTYIKGGCDGAQKCMEMAIFEKPDKTHTVALGVFHEGLKEYFFLEYHDGSWSDVSSTAVPHFSKRNYYEFPRTGTTIRVVEGKVIERGKDWEATEKGRQLYDLEWVNGGFLHKKAAR